jgi:hypothetical protein
MKKLLVAKLFLITLLSTCVLAQVKALVHDIQNHKQTKYFRLSPNPSIMLIWPEHQYKFGAKKFIVHNKTGRKVYTRIEYEACKFDGFTFDPSKSPGGSIINEVRVHTVAGCVPSGVYGELYLEDGTTRRVTPWVSKMSDRADNPRGATWEIVMVGDTAQVNRTY